jgi:hypothetical protein
LSGFPRVLHARQRTRPGCCRARRGAARCHPVCLTSCSEKSKLACVREVARSRTSLSSPLDDTRRAVRQHAVTEEGGDYAPSNAALVGYGRVPEARGQAPTLALVLLASSPRPSSPAAASLAEPCLPPGQPRLPTFWPLLLSLNPPLPPTRTNTGGQRAPQSRPQGDNNTQTDSPSASRTKP